MQLSASLLPLSWHLSAGKVWGREKRKRSNIMVKGRQALPRGTLEIVQILLLKINKAFCKFLFPHCKLSDVIMTLLANSVFIVTGKPFTSSSLWGKFCPYGSNFFLYQFVSFFSPVWGTSWKVQLICLRVSSSGSFWNFIVLYQFHLIYLGLINREWYLLGGKQQWLKQNMVGTTWIQMVSTWLE